MWVEETQVNSGINSTSYTAELQQINVGKKKNIEPEHLTEVSQHPPGAHCASRMIACFLFVRDDPQNYYFLRAIQHVEGALALDCRLHLCNGICDMRRGHRHVLPRGQQQPMLHVCSKNNY